MVNAINWHAWCESLTGIPTVTKRSGQRVNWLTLFLIINKIWLSTETHSLEKNIIYNGSYPLIIYLLICFSFQETSHAFFFTAIQGLKNWRPQREVFQTDEELQRALHRPIVVTLSNRRTLKNTEEDYCSCPEWSSTWSRVHCYDHGIHVHNCASVQRTFLMGLESGQVLNPEG